MKLTRTISRGQLYVDAFSSLYEVRAVDATYWIVILQHKGKTLKWPYDRMLRYIMNGRLTYLKSKNPRYNP